LTWSMLSTTVGVLLSQLERLGFLGNIIRAILGFSWAVCSYFVVPLIIFDNMGPMQALRHGRSKFKRLWRRGLGVAIVIFLFSALVFIVVSILSLLIYTVLPGDIAGYTITGFYVTFFAGAFIANLLSYFVGFIIKSAVYLHFEHDVKLDGFNNELLSLAFKEK